jgi:Protein of unknown function (DUF732)
LEVLVRGAALLLAGVAAFACGCGSPAVTDTAAAPVAAAALPLTEPEYAFIEELQAVGRTVDLSAGAHKLVDHGYVACTAINADGADAEGAVQAVRAQSPLDDATARAVVGAAADHLCPAASG